MFADHLWPNLALFAAGQAAAWYYLHTGRTRVGAAATVALWVLLDWFLVAKYVYRLDGGELQLPLGLLQATALGTAFALAFALWRRRWSRAARERALRFAAAMASYLRGDLDAARATLRGLVRTDPWDAAAWVAFGDVLARAGDRKAARRCYRRALGVDTQKVYGEFVRHQQALLEGARTGTTAADAVAARGAVEPAASS